MYSRTRTARFLAGAVMALLFLMPLRATPVMSQELPPPQPIDLECATDASAQVLKTTPVGDGSETLVLVRVLFEPGGQIGAHNHPGILAVAVETGSLEYVLLDEGETVITRAATQDTEAEEETVSFDEPIVLDPGDTFIDSNKVHSATNRSDGQTAVLIAGLIETGAPLTACADGATPAA